jgi:hypothetical protein
VADSNFDIWRLQANSDVRGLLDAVRQGTPDVRRRAITALRSLSATSAIPALQSILVAEKDAEIRPLLISTLDYLFQQEVDDDDPSAEQHSRVVQFIAQLNSDKPELIIRAIQNLADLNEKIAAESLVVVFHNRQLPPDVRLAAAEALIKLESAPVEITLLGALRHKDWHHRRNAAAVLGQLSADWAIRPLAEALRDEQEIVRRTAYAALKRIATPEALKAIEPPQTVAPTPTTTEKAPEPKPATTSSIIPSAPTIVEPEKPTVPPVPTSDVVTVASPAEPEKPSTQPSDSTEVSLPPPTTDETIPTVESTPAVSTQTTSVSALEVNAPISDEDTQPSTPHVASDDVS